MKVLNLQCAHQHDFEGWFGSEDDFQSQLARGLVECPLCGDRQITKQLSAPRLNLSTSRGEREVSTSTPAQLLRWCFEGRVTDAKTLTGALWLQNVLAGHWPLTWQG